MPNIEQTLLQGWHLHQSGDIASAEAVYRSVLSEVPGDPNALVYLGIALFDHRRYEESADSYRQALQQRDEFPIGWNNLGNTLRMMGQIDEAEQCFEKSIGQDPKYLSAYINRGTLWIWTGEIQRGMAWYQKGLELEPQNVELHRNLGVIHLLLGDYELGWSMYRWRWHMPGVTRQPCAAPLWQGEPLAGKTILLYPEQGRGDSIQFVRMTDVLKRAGATVVLQCFPEMIPLFTSASGVDRLLPLGAFTGQVDYHASLIDAVDVWYTTHNEMPYASDLTDGDLTDSGYLTVSDALIQYWATWLDQHCPVPKGTRRIGINWQGNRQHHADIYRSLPLSAFRPLSELPGVQLVNLQFGDGVEQLDEVDFADKIIRLPEDVDSTGGAFTDTTAILKNLDAVVSSDTALAHMAGAVGAETHLLLGRVPDWRWLLDGETTPWYPTMQLIRQTELGNWDDPVQKIAKSFR